MIILGNTSIAAPITGLFYVAPALCSIACVLHLDMILATMFVNMFVSNCLLQHGGKTVKMSSRGFHNQRAMTLGFTFMPSILSGGCSLDYSVKEILQLVQSIT